MKPSVYYHKKLKNDKFEGSRIRKYIKGALETQRIEYTTTINESTDIVHFYSIKESKKIKKAKKTGKKLVLTTLVAENDSYAQLLNYKKLNCDKLSISDIKILNLFDVILVSDDVSKKILFDNGVNVKIKTAPIGINLSRFKKTGTLEDDIFYSYYQIEKDKNYILSVGSFEDSDAFATLVEVANNCPNLLFYYFGFVQDEKDIPQTIPVAPNVKFEILKNDDLYRSIMKNARIYLAFNSRRHSLLPLYDSVASGTQIVAIEPTLHMKEVYEKCCSYIVKTPYEASDIINQLFIGTLNDKVSEASDMIKEQSLEKLGEFLKETYKELEKRTKQND